MNLPICSVALIPILSVDTPLANKIDLNFGRNQITPCKINAQGFHPYGNEDSLLCYINVLEVDQYEMEPIAYQDIQINGKCLTDNRTRELHANDEFAFLLPFSRNTSMLEMGVSWFQYTLVDKQGYNEKSQEGNLKRRFAIMEKEKTKYEDKPKRVKQNNEGNSDSFNFCRLFP